MADKKISALTASSTPLAGTEVLPIVQSGATVKVSVANLTAGRDVQASNMLVNLTSPPGAFNNTVAVSSGASALAGIQFVNNTVTSAYNTGFQVFLNGTDGYISSFSGPIYIQTGGYTIRAEYDLSGNYKVNAGNVIISGAGKGVTLTSPDGLTTKTLTINNSGVVTLI